MMELTKEFMQDIIKGRGFGVAPSAVEEMARQLLASMEQEPVAEISQAQEYELEGNLRHQRDIDYYQDDIDKLPVGTKLYAAPQLPQPAVPDELSKEEYKRRFMEEDDFDDTYRGGWNACRAAMLQGAEPMQGWIKCSERMPGTNQPVLIFNTDRVEVAYWSEDSELWAWCELRWLPHEITHWIPLPSAPQQEVK